jgi:hypothetical protein
MRTWLTLTVMAVVVAALAAWMYLRPDARRQEETISALEKQHVKRVRLERYGNAPADAAGEAPGPGRTSDTPPSQPLSVSLQKGDGGWRITAPVSARADTFQVDRLISIVEARSAARFPASDLGRFGLDQPVARLLLEDQTFLFGAINATTREQYVLTGGAVHLVPLAYAARLPRDVNALLARELFTAAETLVKIELPQASVALENGRWTVHGAADDASPDERREWVDAWQHASAIRALRDAGSSASEHVTVTFKDGRSIRIGILQRAPDLVLLRTDEGVQYHFFADNAKKLLIPPRPKE